MKIKDILKNKKKSTPPKEKKSKAQRAFEANREKNQKQAREIWQKCVDELFDLGWTPAALARQTAPNVCMAILSLEPIRYDSWVELKEKIAQRATGRATVDATPEETPDK